MGLLSNFAKGILPNEQEKADAAQGKQLWEQRQEAKRKMNNETDPGKRAELQKDFEAKDKAYSDYNSPEQRQARAAQARGAQNGFVDSIKSQMNAKGAIGSDENIENAKAENQTADQTEQKTEDDTGHTQTEQKSGADQTEQKSEGGNMEKAPVGTNGGRRSLSATFYRDLSAGLRGRPTGNTLDVQTATEKEQSQNYKNRSADRQMEAQSSQQIANRNEFAEAGKIASMQNNAENKQNINNLSAAAGSSAALMRKTNTPDVQSQQARQDQQRNVASAQREKSNTAQEEATAASGLSNELEIKSRDYDQDLDTEDRLSKGETIGEEQVEAGEEEQPAEEPVKDEEPKPADEPPAEPEPQLSTTWQNELNYMTYGGDPTSGWSKGTKPGFKEAQDYAAAKKWQPVTKQEAIDNGLWVNDEKGFSTDTGAWEQAMQKLRPDFYKEWAERSGRRGNGKNINRGDAGDDIIDSAQTDTIKSDERVKNVHEPDLCSVLSDLRMKFIREDWDRDGHPSEDDFMWLLKKAGKFAHNDNEYDALEEGSDITDQEVLSGYADFIKNYVYNYKPESGEDTDVTHIGPMAQDIEQVNPACIKEDENGIKHVDTQRLSMMNAGAIGELARMLNDISDRLTKAGI